MSFLANKTWKAQEYYNEYLDLKQELVRLTSQDIDRYKEANQDSVVEYLEKEISKKSKELDFVLEQLELCGVSMKDLIKLGCGLDV